MAASIWNNRLLVGPPVVLLPVKYNIGERAFIQRYKNILNDIDTELRLLKVLEKEVWISKRYSYKYQNSDCNMKWFRQHKMISKACESLIRLHIGKLVVSLIPETLGENLPGMKPNKWPSRQTLEYFLVKLLGFASLCLYIWSLGYKTNELLLQNMEIKNLFLRNLLQAGILSRMQIVAQHLLEKSCKWYTGLYPWLQRLPELESNWLPEGVSLPSSIEEALGSELTELRNITSLSVPKKKKQNTLQRFFNLLDENDVEDAPVPELQEEFDKSIPDTEGMVKGVARTGLSLDDIFSGLVETTGPLKDLVDKTGRTSNNGVSMTTVPESIMKTGTDHMNEQLAESENFATSGGLHGDENRPKEGEENDASHQVQLKRKKKKKKNRHSEIDRILSNQLNQSEDIGVAVSTEEVSSEPKTKKKKERNKQLKRKNRDDEDEVKNNEESPSKRKKPDDDLYKQMEVQSAKGSTQDVKNKSRIILLEEDGGIVPEDATPAEKAIDVNRFNSQDNGLDTNQNQSQASELLTSDISQRKRKKKKKKHLREEIAENSIQEDLLFDKKEANCKREMGEEEITRPVAMIDPAEFVTRTNLGFSDTGKKKKKKRKREISIVPDLDNISSSIENTSRKSKMGKDKGFEQMSQNEQELDKSPPTKRKKRKQKKNKDETIEACNVDDEFTPKEENNSVESVELTGTEFNRTLEMENEGTSKKKRKKKKRNLVGSMMNVEPVGENVVLGMERVRKSDAHRKSKMSFEAVEALSDVNEINIPSGEGNNQRLEQKFQGKVKKKRKKSKKGWKTAFQFVND